MKRIKQLLFFSFFLFLFTGSLKAQETRDPYYWPFASGSFWNVPIGDSAKYGHAQIKPVKDMGMTIDEDLIVMHPNAPLIPLMKSSAGWDRSKSRCIADGPQEAIIPLPKDFTVSKNTWIGNTPNSALAVLMPDGKTIYQTQPFANCSPTNSYPTSKYTGFSTENLYG